MSLLCILYSTECPATACCGCWKQGRMSWGRLCSWWARERRMPLRTHCRELSATLALPIYLVPNDIGVLRGCRRGEIWMEGCVDLDNEEMGIVFIVGRYPVSILFWRAYYLCQRAVFKFSNRWHNTSPFGILTMLALVSFALSALCLAGSSFGTPVHPDWRPSSRCRATSSYPGWSGIKYAFIL